MLFKSDFTVLNHIASFWPYNLCMCLSFFFFFGSKAFIYVALCGSEIPHYMVVKVTDFLTKCGPLVETIHLQLPIR